MVAAVYALGKYGVNGNHGKKRIWRLRGRHGRAWADGGDDIKPLKGMMLMDIGHKLGSGRAISL
jgi:hypothetical protein